MYDDHGKRLILRLKHGGDGAVVPVMARMMTGALADMPKTDLIVPIPLHGRRLLMRRFNQSHLLATAIGRALDIPVDPFLLRRARATKSQGGLGRAARYKNLKGAFAIEPGRTASVQGRHILLVDDVLTTGATASAAARTFIKAGAASVGVVAFARVVYAAP